MQLPENSFKLNLKNKTTQIGLWLGLANSYTAEMAASIGYDWVLIDGEHGPNTLQTILQQLQVIAAYQSSPVVRLPVGEASLIKQYLDIGVQNLLVPMVNDVQQAQNLVNAIHYPPKGIRGVGSAIARASRWNSVENYLTASEKDLCLIAQIETQSGLDNLEEIVAVEGIDAIFIGPADLSASLGHIGNPNHPMVQKEILNSLEIIHKYNKAAGILYVDEEYAKKYIEMGFEFVAVGVDTTLFIQALKNKLGIFKDSKEVQNNSVY